MRAVDSRLKMEWIHWAENGLYCKGIQNKRRRQPYDFSSTTEIPDSTLVGLARTTNMGQGCGAASRYLPSAETQGLLQRRKRRLRAWCSKVGVEARVGNVGYHSSELVMFLPFPDPLFRSAVFSHAMNVEPPSATWRHFPCSLVSTEYT